MAYLRWSGSPWYAYASADGGDRDEEVLIAWHGQGARVAVTAGELLRAGCEGQPERLRAFMERRVGNQEPAQAAAMKDVDALAPAVDQFLFEICNAGKIPMPPEVANRYRELTRLIDEAVSRPSLEQAADSRGLPMWFAWSAEVAEIKRRHPPPRLSREIRDLMQRRALRALGGQSVSPGQDALERARIAAACEWPPD